MKKFLKAAALAWTKATLNIQKFADAYVAALIPFGDDAREDFALSYPMFGPREWERLEMVGNGILLPQFMFKSDSFVGKIIRMNDSMKFQKALVGASESGMIRVDRGRGPETVHLSELTRNEDKMVALLMSESDEHLTEEELKTKFRTMVLKVNKQCASSGLPKWQIHEIGSKKVARVNRVCTLDKDEIEKMLDGVSGKKKKLKKYDANILNDIVDSIVELESLRDEEWDFETDHGPSRECWSKEVEDKHENLLDRIQKCRMKVRNLARKATGNKKLEV